MRVGDRGPVTAVRVAHRARVGAGRPGADLEGALGRQPGDRAAARADGDHVDHRDLRRVLADAALGGQRRLTVDDDRDVGGGAAAVAGQHPVEAGRAGDQRGAQGAGGRAGQHRGDRLVDHLGGAQHAAVALHHVERHAGRELVQPAADVADVGAHPGLHRGVDQRGHRALVLAVLAQHLAGDAHDGVGVLLAEDGEHPLLVRVVGVGVQEADADRADAGGAEEPGRRPRLRLVERADLGAGVVQPAAHGAHQVGRDDPWRLHPEVAVAVPVGHRLAGDLQHRLVALGGDEADPVQLALEQLVGGHRRPVADRGDRRPVHRHQVQDLPQSGEEALGRVGGRRRRLRRPHLAGLLVHGDDVGEGAPGVDADAYPTGRCAHARKP